MELLEKSIKQALENMWTAANCVDPTDGIIDKQGYHPAPTWPLTLAVALTLGAVIMQI